MNLPVLLGRADEITWGGLETAADRGELCARFPQLSVFLLQLITSFDDETEESPWASCPPDLNEELRLVCREELLQCLEKLGSWKELDELATSIASALTPDDYEPMDASSSSTTSSIFGRLTVN